VCERYAGQSGWTIDSLEVTRSNYQAFLIAKRGDVSGQSNACSSNTTYTPSTAWPPLPEELQLPVVNVDWCDASAYCNFMGQQLCGKVGGGAGTGDPNEGQWISACNGGDATRLYAYGNSYVAGRCNSAGPAAVGSFPQCVGVSSKLFDMSGNVAEWIYDCANEFCMTRGAAADQETSYGPEVQHRCDSVYSYDRMHTADNLGFRCCSDP
jgi:formylglycine-generating enzyme required for sulfatase activity